HPLGSRISIWSRQVNRSWVQPPDAENRMSGGVEGSWGAIPMTPSDPADEFMKQAMKLAAGIAGGMR
ncbi:MAG: hypothetical protein Q7R22_016120, partial [Verrucomicrobiota bacterium JB025]